MPRGRLDIWSLVTAAAAAAVLSFFLAGAAVVARPQIPVANVATAAAGLALSLAGPRRLATH